jgi:hypothetical protein
MWASLTVIDGEFKSDREILPNLLNRFFLRAARSFPAVGGRTMIIARTRSGFSIAAYSDVAVRYLVP